MSDITDETIENLAKLCRFELTKEDKVVLFEGLNKVIDFVEELNEVNTDDVDACHQVIKNHRHLMREDDVGELLPRDVFLKNAPDQIGGMIKVPPIIKK